MNEVSSMQPNNVDAQDLSGVLAVHHLCHSLALLLCQGLQNAHIILVITCTVHHTVMPGFLQEGEWNLHVASVQA